MESIGLSKAIGENVATLRARRKMGQVDLAQALKKAFGLAWSTNTVARVETGHREVLAGELVALGIVLQVTAADLLRSDKPVRLGRGPSTPLPPEDVAAWAQDQSGQASAVVRLFAEAVGSTTAEETGRSLAEYLEALMPSRLLGQRFSEERRSQIPALVEYIEQALGDWQQAEEDAGRQVTPRRIQGKRAYLWRQLSQETESSDLREWLAAATGTPPDAQKVSTPRKPPTS